VFEHVLDGLAEPRVGFNQLLLELRLTPRLEVVHDRAAVLLVVGEALVGGKTTLFDVCREKAAIFSG
jgi:hypothetical protein